MPEQRRDLNWIHGIVLNAIIATVTFLISIYYLFFRSFPDSTLGLLYALLSCVAIELCFKYYDFWKEETEQEHARS